MAVCDSSVCVRAVAVSAFGGLCVVTGAWIHFGLVRLCECGYSGVAVWYCALVVAALVAGFFS